MFRTLSPSSVAVVALLGAWMEPLAAQRFEGEEWVVEVEVPVNVVDRDGNPVRGLTREDFELLDRGEQREITGFQVIDLDLIQPQPTDAVEPLVPAAARRHFLLLFDLSYSTPISILKARQAARNFVVESLHPTDLAAVMTFSLQHGVRLLVTFTPDRAQLARAIDTLGVPSLLASHGVTQDPLQFMIDTVDGASGGSSGGTLGEEGLPDITLGAAQEALTAHLNVIAHEMARQEKSFARGQVAAWSATLEGLAEVLAQVDGRKQIVYFSEGFDGRLVLGRRPDSEDPQQTADRRNMLEGRHWLVDTDDLYGNTVAQNDVTRMLEQFRRADCLVQAVDISGLRADEAEQGRSRQAGRDVLFYLANDTGGRLIDKHNEFDHELKELLVSSAVTYLITFRAAGVESDGAYHRIEVKADLPRGARLTHRPGYYAPSSFEKLHPLERNLLAADAIAAGTPRTDVGLEVLAAPFRAAPGEAYVPVILEIDGPSLLVGHRQPQLPLEIYAYVTDAENRMRDFFTQRITLDVEKGREVLSRGGVKFYGHLELAPGSHLVRALVRNGTTGRSGVSTSTVEVPGFTEGEPMLVGPFFFDTPGHWLLVREQASTEGESVVYPFTVNGDVYIPAIQPEVVPGKPARMVLVGYNLAPGDLSLRPQVSGSTGEIEDFGTVTIEERTVTGIAGYDKVLATLVAGDNVIPGDYNLQLTLTSARDPRKLLASIPVRVPVH